MKKSSYLLALVIFATFLLPKHTLSSDQFFDVNENHKNKTAIDFLKDTEIINGYSDGTFKPDDTINRAELLKIVIESKNIDFNEANYVNCFNDIQDQWFAPYVCYAKEQGWINGYSDNTFRPNRSISKAEALKIIMNIYGITSSENNAQPFDDVVSNMWYANFVGNAKGKGLLEETGDYFEPTREITRGGVSEIIFRAIVILETDVNVFIDQSLDDIESIKKGFLNRKNNNITISSNNNASNEDVDTNNNPTINDQLSAIVKILIVNNADEITASGSGVRINQGGDILTNLHVVEEVVKDSNKNYMILCFTESAKSAPECNYNGEIVDFNEPADIALIKPSYHFDVDLTKKDIIVNKIPIDKYFEQENIDSLPYIKFNRNDIIEPELSEELQVLGYPAIDGYQITFTKGVVNGFDSYEEEGEAPITLYIRTDAALRPGNSGGAAFDSKNQFVGIPSMVSSEYDEIGYILAMPAVLYFLDETGESNMVYCEDPSNPTKSTCSCNEGYEAISIINTGGKSIICQQTNPFGCGKNSYNVAGTHYCTCKAGYVWKENMTDDDFTCVADLESGPLATSFDARNMDNVGDGQYHIFGASYEVMTKINNDEIEISWKLRNEEDANLITKHQISIWENTKPSNQGAYKPPIKREITEKNSMFFSYDPKNKYYIEILGEDEDSDALNVLRLYIPIREE